MKKIMPLRLRAARDFSPIYDGEDMGEAKRRVEEANRKERLKIAVDFYEMQEITPLQVKSFSERVVFTSQPMNLVSIKFEQVTVRDPKAMAEIANLVSGVHLLLERLEFNQVIIGDPVTAWAHFDRQQPSFGNMKHLVVHETSINDKGMRAILETFGTAASVEFTQLGRIESHRVLDDLVSLIRTNISVEELNLRGTPVQDWVGAAHFAEALGARPARFVPLKVKVDDVWGGELRAVDHWSAWFLTGLRVDKEGDRRECQTSVELARAVTASEAPVRSLSLKMRLWPWDEDEKEQDVEKVKALTGLATHLKMSLSNHVPILYLENFEVENIAAWRELGYTLDALTPIEVSCRECRGLLESTLGQMKSLQVIRVKGGAGWSFAFLEMHVSTLRELHIEEKRLYEIIVKDGKQEYVDIKGELIMGLSGMTALKRLTLENVGLGDGDIPNLVAWISLNKGLANLESLSLAGNWFGFDGFKALAEFLRHMHGRPNPSLASLTISFRGEQSASALELQKASHEINLACLRSVDPKQRGYHLAEYHWCFTIFVTPGRDLPWLANHVDVHGRWLLPLNGSSPYDIEIVGRAVLELRSHRGAAAPKTPGVSPALAREVFQDPRLLHKIMDSLVITEPGLYPAPAPRGPPPPDDAEAIATAWKACVHNYPGGLNRLKHVVKQARERRVKITNETYVVGAIFAYRARLTRLDDLDVLSLLANASDVLEIQERNEALQWTFYRMTAALQAFELRSELDLTERRNLHLEAMQDRTFMTRALYESVNTKLWLAGLTFIPETPREELALISPHEEQRITLTRKELARMGVATLESEDEDDA